MSGNEPDNFSEIFKQFSELGLDINSLIASLSNSGNPATISQLSHDVIRDVSRKFLAARGELPVGATDLEEMRQALSIANTWVDVATTFPALSPTRSGDKEKIALSRKEWIDETLLGWQEIAAPLISGMSQGIEKVIKEVTEQSSRESASHESDGENPPEINILGFAMPGMSGLNIPQLNPAQVAGAISALMSSLMSTQLGQTIGTLAATVTGANDVAIPLTSKRSRTGSSGHATPQTFLIPQNVREWGKDLEIPETEVHIFLALREVAAARLFANAPWLSDYINEAISSYGKGINIDIGAIQRQAEEALSSGEIDPNNPESISRALSHGIFSPEQSPAQGQALEKLEMVLALIEGWIDDVVTTASGDRLPSLIKLRETLQRRRATHSPTEQLFASLVGLEVSPRRARECSLFWRRIAELREIEGRDQLWEEAILLPTQENLADPEGFLQSTTVPDDISGLQ